MTRKTFSRRFLSISAAWLAITVASLASQAPSHAGAFTYSSSLRTFNVANLLIQSAGQTTSLPSGSPGTTTQSDRPGSFEFYVLNNRPDIRPNGWVLDNPLAPKVVTTQINGRYGNAYNVGQAITPNMPAYWTLDLSDQTSVTDLQQYDLLVVHTHMFGDFDQAQRSILRQYVDQGGTLLFDDCGGGDYVISDGSSSTTYHGFSGGYGMFIDVQWWGDHGNNGLGVVPIAGQRHPIITSPYFLSQDEINQLGDKNVTNYFMTSGRGITNNGGSTSPSTAPDPSMFTTVIGNSAHLDGNNKPLPYISAGDYGAGHIVISAADICDDISNPVGGSAYAGTNLQASHTEDLKMLSNILAFSEDASDSEGANPRHSGSQTSEFNGALLPLWRYRPMDGAIPTAPHPYTASATEPAIYGNIAYVTDAFPGGSYLHAFDLVPSEDLDGTGTPDNGNLSTNTFGLTSDPLTGVAFTQDYSHGLKYDALWTLQMTSGTGGGSGTPETKLSSPTVAIVPQINRGTPVTYVLTEGMTGNVYGVVAGSQLTSGCVPIAAVSTATFAGSGSTTSTGGTFTNVVPPAPTAYRGRIYAVEPDKNLLVISPGDSIATDNLPYAFEIPLPPTASGIAYSPTVASIPSQDGVFKGNDVVVTIATSGGVSSFILGSRDEALNSSTNTTPGLPSSGLQVYVTKTMRLGTSNGWIADVAAGPEDRGVGYNEWVYWLDSYTPAFTTNPTTLTAANFTSYNETNPAMLYGGSVATEFFTVTPATNGAVGTTPTGNPQLYGDYDIEPPTKPGSSAAGMISPAPLRTNISVQVTTVNANAYTQLAAGSAIDTPDNLTIYTANTTPSGGSTTALSSGYIAAINDQNTLPFAPGASMKWRFALVGGNPHSASGSNIPVVDADGINYEFAGYQFVGPPVAGPAGVVYALAKGPSIINGSGTDTIVMCFDTNPTIHANVAAATGAFQSAIIQQLDETNYLGGTPPSSAGSGTVTVTLQPNQYSVNNQDGYIQLNDCNGSPFYRNGTIQPNAGFPMPIFVNLVNGSSQSGTSILTPLSSENNGQPLLQWWAPVTGCVPTATMRKLGNWLYFGATITGTVSPSYKIIAMNADPIENGFPIDGGTRMVDVSELTNTKFLQEMSSDVGSITSPVVASGRYAVVQGADPANTYSGIEGFGNLFTLVADNNRLVEFDASGDADWTCDSTVAKQFQGGDLPVDPDGGTETVPPTATSVQTTSKVSLNRPSTIAQITPNDYLVADSGNNRCVQFDRSGRVIWECTSFEDPNHLLGAGQSLTLRKPGSVIIWATQRTVGSSTYSDYHYLIADTGNYRVLEIVDTQLAGENGYFDNSGTFIATASAVHKLVWVSHTYDQQGRTYSYVGAQRYFAPDGSVYIMAAVSNKRIAPILEYGPSGGNPYSFNLQPPSADTSGSSLVCLYFSAVYSGDPYHPVVPSNAPTDAASGQIVYQYQYSGAWFPFPLITGKTIDTANSFGTTLPSTLPLPTPLRNVRFLVDYFKYSSTATNQEQRTLVCDDDGVFDALPQLVWANAPQGTASPYNSDPSTEAANAIPRQYTWTLYAIGREASSGSFGYDSSAFQYVQRDYNNTTAQYVNSSGQIPFADTLFEPASALLLSNGDYLISNQGAAGDSSSPDHARIGGSVVEIDPLDTKSAPVGPIYGIPTNTGGLIQPSFALRPL